MPQRTPSRKSLRVALDFFEDHYKDISDSIAITTSDALTHILGIRADSYSRHNRALAPAMEALGYVKKEFKNKTLKGRFYVRPDASKPIAFDLGMMSQFEAYRASPDRHQSRNLS